MKDMWCTGTKRGCFIKRWSAFRWMTFLLSMRNGSKVIINRWAHTAHEAMQSIKYVLRNPGFVEFVDVEDNLNIIKTENICKITIE